MCVGLGELEGVERSGRAEVKGAGGGGTWVIPPASPAATDVLRRASKRDVCRQHIRSQLHQAATHKGPSMLY